MESRPIARAGTPQEPSRHDRSLAVDSDIVYLVTYSCPRCHLELEAEHGGWLGWLLCPECATPALPPEALLGHPSTRRRIREMAVDDAILVIGPDGPENTTASDSSALIGKPTSSLISAVRLVFLTGLVMSLFLLLIAYLDENQLAAGIFGALALVFFLLTLRFHGRSKRSE
jgi:hypothetical protein